MRHLARIIALTAACFGPSLSLAQSAEDTLSRWARFFDVPAQGTTVASDRSAGVLAAMPWTESFAMGVTGGDEFSVTVSGCSAALVARAMGLEPDAPGDWPVYRGYVLRCMALQDMDFLAASPDLSDSPPPDMVTSLPLGTMLPEIHDDPAARSGAIALVNAQGQISLDDAEIYLEHVAAYTRDGDPGAILLVMVQTAGSSGSATTDDLFRLQRSNAEAPYQIVRHMIARSDN